MLADTDTIALRAGIIERGNAMSWFWTDWPLANHFYRPISTLTMEWDMWRWGNWAEGFGMTNALLVIFCVWGVFALVLELSGRPLEPLWQRFYMGLGTSPFLGQRSLQLLGGLPRFAASACFVV